MMNDTTHKKQTYALRDMSYMSLSIGYIGLLVAIAVFSLLLFGYYILQARIFIAILIALFGSAACSFIVHTGTKYGTYGLEIIIGKIFQRKQIKNDFPNIERLLLHRSELIQNSILE